MNYFNILHAIFVLYFTNNKCFYILAAKQSMKICITFVFELYKLIRTNLYNVSYAFPPPNASYMCVYICVCVSAEFVNNSTIRSLGRKIYIRPLYCTGVL